MSLDAFVPAGSPAPAAPAPAAPPAGAPSAPSVSPMESFLASAREKLASGQSPLNFAPAEPPAPAPTPQPRDPNGQYASPSPSDPSQPPVDPSQAPAPDAAADPDAPAGDESPAPLRVALPGRSPNAPDVEIEVDDPEVAERLRQLKNGFMRGEEVRQAQAEVEQSQMDLQEIEMRLQVDPEGFIFEHIPRDRAASIAVQLLAEPGVWEQVERVVMQLDDPDTREIVRTRMENERLKNRDSAAERYQQVEAERRSIHGVKQAIALHIPEHLPEQQQLQLYQQLQQDVRAYMDRTGMRVLDPRDVPVLIAGRLREAGIDPLAVSQSVRTGGRPTAGPPNTPSTPRTARAVKAGVPTAADLARSGEARRAMSLGSPGGASPSAAGMGRPPKGQTLDERIAWARQNMTFGGSAV